MIGIITHFLNREAILDYSFITIVVMLHQLGWLKPNNSWETPVIRISQPGTVNSVHPTINKWGFDGFPPSLDNPTLGTYLYWNAVLHGEKKINKNVLLTLLDHHFVGFKHPPRWDPSEEPESPCALRRPCNFCAGRRSSKWPGEKTATYHHFQRI